MKKSQKPRLIIGDLVRVRDLWSDAISDWVDVDLVGVVIGINESECLDKEDQTHKRASDTFVTILVNGVLLEEEYIESDLTLIKTPSG